ncbi:MAG: hypothetical protein ABIH42_09450 [Planctomycetota bacterium]
MIKKIYVPFILVILVVAGLIGYQSINAATYVQPLYGSYDNVPTADSTANVVQRDVVGNKTDAAAAGAVSTTESLMAYAKQNVTEQIVIDTNVDAILVDTGTTIPGTITTLQTDATAILLDTGTTLPAEIKQYGVGTVVTKQSAIAAAGTVTLFTVTGEVEMVIIGYIDVAMTGTTGTLEVGIAGTTAGLIAQAAQAALLIDLLWVDATPAAIIAKPTYKVVANGADVIQTAGGTVTASTVTYYCYWRPLSSDGNVVAA